VIAGCGTGSDNPELFRAEGRRLVETIEAEGMAAFADVYARGPTRRQLLRKDPLGWREFRDQLAEHSARGSALMLDGAGYAELSRPSSYVKPMTYGTVAPGLFDAIVDIPFALPTAVAGVALTSLFAEKGWLGAPLAAVGIKVAFTPVGIFVAMVFIGIPFVVRTVQPVLIDLDPEIEEAAASLGANRWHTVSKVILPSLIPALLTGLALAFARAVGEYGSVIFIAGNLPNVSEIAPLLIVIRLSEFRYADATAIAVVMLVVSFVIIFAVNRLQRWAQSRIPAR